MPRESTLRRQARQRAHGRGLTKRSDVSAFVKRSLAARKGWETRKARERERKEEWKFSPGKEWIVEEPIDEVGGFVYP